MLKLLAATTVATLLLAVPASAASKPADLPAGFVKVSDALKNPGMAYIPGIGTLYVDAKTLPAGPFFGYNKAGKLVNITYMVPLKDINAHKEWMNAGQSAKGKKVDHTDIYVSDAHPGVPEPHLHIVNWLISPAEVKAMGEYKHMH
jgi:hypothetical protein